MDIHLCFSRFLQAGGSPEKVVEMLSDNYTAVAQTVNLLAEWLIQAGNVRAYVNNLASSHFPYTWTCIYKVTKQFMLLKFNSFSYQTKRINDACIKFRSAHQNVRPGLKRYQYTWYYRYISMNGMLISICIAYI